MVHRGVVVLALVAFASLVAAPARAGLCMRKNGSVMLRDACRRKEKPVTAWQSVARSTLLEKEVSSG